MVDPWLLYTLVGIALLLSAVAAVGAWRPHRGEGITEAALEAHLSELKGGLVSELARTRTAVESGMRDSGEAYFEAQEVLARQIDGAVERLRAELLAANAESSRAVLAAMEQVFAKAQQVQDLSLRDQTLLLKDLKSNYERAIAELRAAVSQSSARQNEALAVMSDQVRGALLTLAGEIQQNAAGYSQLHERVESALQIVEGRVA